LERFSEIAGASKPSLFSGKWVNTANFLTALRVFLVPPIILLLVYTPGHLPGNMPYSTLAGLIFIFAAMTDKLDGYYARKNDLVTRLGQFLDPLADKLLMLPVMITLCFMKPQLLPFWVVIVVATREFLISAIRFIGAKRGLSFPASWSGKIKMFSQVIVVSTLIIFPRNYNDLFVRILVYGMTAITAYSGVDYFFRARREIFYEKGDNG